MPHDICEEHSPLGWVSFLFVQGRRGRRPIRASARRAALGLSRLQQSELRPAPTLRAVNDCVDPAENGGPQRMGHPADGIGEQMTYFVVDMIANKR